MEPSSTLVQTSGKDASTLRRSTRLTRKLVFAFAAVALLAWKDGRAPGDAVAPSVPVSEDDVTTAVAAGKLPRLLRSSTAIGGPQRAVGGSGWRLGPEEPRS